MVIRRCPKCHTASDDVYGFCIKCGYEFPKINSAKVCVHCGYSNPVEAEYCVKCGIQLILRNPDETPKKIIINKEMIENAQHGEENKLNPIIIKKEVNDTAENYRQHRTNSILILVGYIFSILGGIIGLIIAIYLVTRKNPEVKKHGFIQLTIFAFYVILIGILIATGIIPTETLTNYKQFMLGNFTKP